MNDDPFHIPDFCRLTDEQRRAAWERFRPAVKQTEDVPAIDLAAREAKSDARKRRRLRAEIKKYEDQIALMRGRAAPELIAKVEKKLAEAKNDLLMVL